MKNAELVADSLERLACTAAGKGLVFRIGGFIAGLRGHPGAPPHFSEFPTKTQHMAASRRYLAGYAEGGLTRQSLAREARRAKGAA